MMETENRRSNRIAVELKVLFTPTDAETPYHQRGQSLDLSREGMRLKTNFYDTLNQEIKGRIFPPEEDPIAFSAKVLWNKPAPPNMRDSGLKFTEMSQYDKTRLDALLKSIWTQMLTA